MTIALRNRLVWIPMLIGLGSSVCRAQVGDVLNFMSNRTGIYWSGVSVFSGYTNSSSSFSITGPILGSNSPAPRSYWNYGVSTGIGWQHTTLKTNFNVRYSMSYVGVGSYSRFDPLNSTLGASTGHTWGKWTGSLSGSVQVLSTAEYPFQMSGLGALSQSSTSFDNLSAAFSVGQFSNLQSAGALDASALSSVPAIANLYGGRVLSYFLSPTLSYARSERWNFHFSSGTAFGQTRLDGHATTTPRGLAFSGGVGANYMLSPRTQLGFDVEEQTSINRYQKAYGTNGMVSLGRKMGEHWLLRGYGGTAVGMFISQVYGHSSTPPIIGGGSAAFQWQSSTLLGTYSRSAFDSYGYGAGTNSSMTAAWSYQRPAAWWRTTAQFRRYQIRNTGFATVSGMSGSVSLSARLKGNLAASAQYVYFGTSGTYVGVDNTYNFTGLRFTLRWAPQAAQPHP